MTWLNRFNFRLPLIFFAIFATLFLSPATDRVNAQELERQASWQTPDIEFAKTMITEWCNRSDKDPEVVMRQFLEQSENEPHQWLDASLNVIAELYPDSGPVIESLKVATMEQTVPELRHLLNEGDSESLLSWLASVPLPASALTQVQLGVGCWMVRHQRFDEALQLLQLLEIGQVIDPAALLFYTGLAQHRLLKTEACVTTLQKLLENELELPHRFQAVGALMLADIQSLEEESLDQIARMMQDILRRQAFHRSGTRVIGKEQEVIDLLDKLIEETEQKLKKQQQQQSASPQGGSGQPMEQSQNAKQLGDGNVTDKNMQAGKEWGSLPPKQREAILAEMARDLPPHFREVIEEYFRQMARERKNHE